MEVILTKDVDKLGKAGTVVKVKDGFARNLLMPRGLAVEVTPGNLKILEQNRQKTSLKSAKEKDAALSLKERLDNLSLTVSALVQEGESLYGSVAVADILDALKEEGVTVGKQCIILDEPIKALGIYEVPVKLHPEVTGKLKVWVVKK